MKKLFMVILMIAMAYSCTPTNDDDATPQAQDPEKVCPPNDRDCNGIPDDEEN